MLITMSITVEEADEVEARRVAAALAAALAPTKPEPKAAKPVAAEAKPEPKAAKPVAAEAKSKAAKPVAAEAKSKAAKPVAAEAKPESKAAKAEAKPESKAAKPEAKPESKAAGDDPTEDELLDQAALHAVALMQAGLTGSVREALTAVGARRVSQIQGVDNLQKFISLLPEVPASEDA